MDKVLEYAAKKKGVTLTGESKNVINQVFEDAESKGEHIKLPKTVSEAMGISQNPFKGVAESFGSNIVYGVQNTGINLAGAAMNAQKEGITTQLDYARPAVENGINYYDYAKQMEIKYGNYMNELMTNEERILLDSSRIALEMGITNIEDLNHRKKLLQNKFGKVETWRASKSKAISQARQNIDDKYRLGKVGEFAQDAGSAIGFMTPSIAVGAITKNPSLALGTMATMGGAQGYGQAKDAGATHGQAAAYGIASGALEAGIERLGGGALGKIYGKGLDDVLLKKLGKDAIDNKTLKGVGINTARTMTGEGIEEGLATAADPFLQRATYDPNAENASLKEIGYSAGLGAAVGGLLGGGINTADYMLNRKKKSAEEIVAEIKATTPNSAPNETETRAEANTSTNETKPLETKMQSAEQTMPSAEENAQIEKEFKTFADLALNKMHLRKVYDDMPMNRNAYIQGDVVHINKNKMTAEDVPALKRVLAHEIYHSIESTKEGQRIYELAVEGQDANALLQAKYNEYLAEGITLDEAGQRAEVAADFIEKAMTDEATINRILTEDRTVIAKIVEYIKDVIEAIKAKRTKTPEDTQELIRLQKARRQYETALAKVQKGEYEAGFYGEEGEVRTHAIKQTANGEKYDYDTLVQKPDMKVALIKDRAVIAKKGKIDQSAMSKEALQNADINANGGYAQRYVYINDIKENVLLNRDGIVHGIQGNKTKNSTLQTAEVMNAIADILRNSIAINERAPRDKDNTLGSYELIGYGEKEDGTGYIVKAIVNRLSENKALADTIEIYTVLKGFKAKKIRDTAQGGYNKQSLPAIALQHGTPLSTISIAELLDIVKDNYPQILSKNVLEHYGLNDVTQESGIRYSVGKLDDAVEKKVPYKFYDNTFQNTPIFDDAVKEAELLYGHERERVSEKETIEEAKRRLEENGWEKEMRSLSRKKDLDGADTDVAMGIMSHMNDFEVGTDEFDRLMRFSEDYAEKTVEAGQFIQALAKYSRTPAGLTQKGVRDVKREQKKVQEENPKKWNKAEKNAVEINNTVKKAQEDSINEVLDAVAKKVDEKTAEKILTKPKKEKKNKKKNPAESLATKISLHVEPKDDTIANAQLQKDIVNELYKLAKESPLPEMPVAKQKKDYVAHLVKILQNYDQYEDVWYDAKEILIKKYKDDPEKMKALEDYFNNYAIPIYSKASLNNAIADQMKTLDIKWNDLLFDTKATQQEKESKIKDALLNELGVEDNEMLDVITNDIMHSLNTKVAEKAKKYLEQREKPKDEKDTKARVTAEEKIIRLVKKGIYNPDEARRLVQSAFDVPTLTSEDMKNVMAYYEKAAEYKEGSYEYRKWNSKAQSIIADKTPKTKAEKHNSYRRIMMLLNPTTWARNIGGNVMFGGVEAIKNIPGGAIDVLVAKKTGVRTTSANPFADIKAFYEGAKKGTAEWARDFAEGVDTSANAVREEYQLTSGKTWSDAKAYGKALNRLEKVMSKGLQIGDRPIYEGAYAQRLNELKRLGYDTELETVQNMAKEYALERVFQNNSKISDAVISVRNRLGWFGRIILPFAQTPGNILDKTIDYSAVGGFVRAAGQLKTASKTGVFDQKLFVDRMGRVFTGAGLIAMGYLLAKSGLLVGGEDDNYKVRQAERLGGKKKYALHIDGKYYTIDWASPTAAVLLAGAEGYEAGLEEDDFLAIAAASGQAMINSIFATSLLSNLETLMSAGYGDDPDIAKAITDAIIGAASQYFPAIVRKANNVFDPVQRDTYDPNALKAQGKYLLSGIPGFSYLLEPKYDIEGKVTMKSQGRGIGNRAVENFILPMNVSTEYHSKVNDELLRLYEATGETNQLLRSASKKLNLGESGTYVLEAKEHNDMQKFMGVNSVREIEKLMASSTYKQMDDETKAESIGDIVGFYENQYKDNYAKKNKIEYENKSYQELKKKVADAGSWANYFANNNAFGAGSYESKVERKELCDKYKIKYDAYQSISDAVKDVKEKNKSIEKASKKADANRKAVAQTLYDADLTDIQRQALWEKIGGYDGKTSMTYKQAVRTYGIK